jgi:acyl-CoA reductase-like NAD-dependent aldehyde dehydrogenase
MIAPIQHEDKQVVPCLINGKPTEVDADRLIEVTSSAQGKVVGYAQSADVKIAQAAVDSAAKEFKTYSEWPYHKRRQVLLRAAEELESRVEVLTRYQIDETSCPEPWARFNIFLAAKAIREIASSITIACTGEMPPPETGSAFCLVYKQAIGPVLSIAPWNGSIILSSRTLAAPLAAGCTIVFKASELSPRTHHGVVEAFLAAGIPPGALNQIQVRREDAVEVTESIIAHPAIRKIEFIGSAAVGRSIGQMAAKHMKPILMELGGKGPAIVLKDADLQKAAILTAQGAMLHHGLVCMSTERIIVEEAVAEEFIMRLRNVVASLKGDAGFAVTKAMAAKARKLMSDALENGAELLIGNNNERGDTGAALEPTIITGVKPGNPIHDLETFGPSATLYIAKDENEAVDMANDSSYGLTGAIHTRDILKGLLLAKQLDVGMVALNSMTLWEESPVPMGGVKGSGWGNNNSRYAVEEFLILKAIAVVDPEGPIAFGSA